MMNALAPGYEVIYFQGSTDVIVRGPVALREWREKNRLHVPGYEYMPLYTSGKWDGTRAPGQWCREVGEHWELKCSFGLLPRLCRDLGIPTTPLLRTADEALAFLAGHPQVAILRDLQREAFVASLMNGWGRVAMATNAGKGAVIALLALYMTGPAYQGEGSALVLCDELAVFDALEGELDKWAGVPHHTVTSGMKEPPPEGGITLAMVKTLARRLELARNAGGRLVPKHPEWHEWAGKQTMVLLDEADKATAETWKTCLRATHGSSWRIGFSGTFPEDPFSDLVLDELMGPVIARVKNKELIGLGVSAKPLIELHSFEVTETLPLKWPRGVWGAATRALVYERAIVRNKKRHDFIAGLVREGARTAIVVNRVEHGSSLSAAIPGAVFLDGSVGQAERIEVLDAFKRGEVQVIVVTKILDRGTNRLGHATDLIFASGEGSVRQNLQRIGRGLRRADGKAELRLVDVIDRVTVEEDFQETALEKAQEFLHNAGKARVELYESEGFDVRIVA